ncbi:UDP-N-acetylglucosamine--N-acetylmuramyl-(pentapeptide) pyrophosphoryl-undecaprenol N-acetylglucosamine transferase [Patescibacteria group bacterium]|nr:UDP-N-acetylglucosamine--N-acetylmuramyl-(pentapeptide) pyrophosphoryl-undecaprenol N-acetylglucosamine transferase [Patescibacteria group bacterium]
MKILLTGGGTGGHFYPILSVSRALKKIAERERIFEMELTYFSDDPFDADLLRQEGIRFKKVSTGKVRRYFSFRNFTDIFKTLWGVGHAIFNIFFDIPDVIFAKGGYASFPALVASRFFRIPVIIHESDTVPGRVNRWAGKFARSIAISFPEAISYFPEGKTALVGSPIRPRILGGNTEEAKLIFGYDGAPVLLILGGSQGSEIINNAVSSILPELIKEARIIHQCGEKNLDSIKKQSSVILEKSELKDRYRLFGTLGEDELRNASCLAILIVSRAGGGAIFEIAAWGKPAILIPLAGAAQDHQRKNAYAYARTGAANVIEEVNLTPHILLAEIKKILSDTARQERMRTAASRFAKVDGAEKIAREIITLALEHAS